MENRLLSKESRIKIDLREYVQYQFKLPSEDLDPEFIEELSNTFNLPFDEDDYRERWVGEEETNLYIIRDVEKDPNTFIIVQIVGFNAYLTAGEYYGLLLRFKKDYEEAIQQSFYKLWKTGSVATSAQGRRPPNFKNMLGHPQWDWSRNWRERYQLDVEVIE